MARRPVLENAVMDVLWRVDDWLTSAQVQAQMVKGESRAYTTVMTALVRLWTKGRLERRRSGRAYEYRATVGREEFAAAQMEDMLAIANDRADALSRFVDTLSSGDRTRLRKTLGSR